MFARSFIINYHLLLRYKQFKSAVHFCDRPALTREGVDQGVPRSPATFTPRPAKFSPPQPIKVNLLNSRHKPAKLLHTNLPNFHMLPC